MLKRPKYAIKKSAPKVLYVGLWINRNWILGNWIKELKSRSEYSGQIWWVASVFAGKHFWEKFVHFPLPKADFYFFSYPSIFESYIKSNPSKYSVKSIVNYTHNLAELGTLEHQAKLLNNALVVHFNCTKDAENLVEHGLDPDKIRIVLGAIDDDCIPTKVARDNNTVLLASRFGERKGVTILPDIVRLLPHWNFVVLGRGWEDFIKSSGLNLCHNFELHYFNKNNRNYFMSKAKIFLSLSLLEGGPIPLIEAMYLGAIPIVTDTGFARDVVSKNNGIILNNPPKVSEVVEAIENVNNKTFQLSKIVPDLTWSRIAKILDQDITEAVKISKGNL